MRGVLVRNVGFSILALALSVFAGCNDNPLGFDVKDSKDILVDPSSMVLSAGRPGKITSRTVNQGLEPTFDEIVAQRDPACGSATITIEEDLSLAPAFPPGVFDVTGGTTLGTTCVVLTSGNLSKTVDVTVVADAIEVVSAPASVRAGEGGTIVARLIDVDGTEVLPYDPLDVGWSSNDSDILDLSAGDGTFTTSTAGTSEITLTWTGQEANGTAGTGVVRIAELVIEVGSNVPVAASYTVADTATENLGAHEVGDVVEFPILVTDAEGNQVTDPLEVLGITLDEPLDPAVTATARIAVDEVVQGNEPYVEITAVAGGQPVVSGTVQTSEGDLAFTGVFSVLAPTIGAVTPDNGVYAEVVTISGTGFAAEGFVASVAVDGLTLGNFTVVSDTEITAQMPTFGTAGTFDVTVDLGGVVSPAASWTQNAGFDIKAFEPGNEIPETAVEISVPAVYSGTFGDGAVTGDLYDFVRYTVSDDVNVLYEIDWTPSKDLDGIEFDCFDSALVFTFACYTGVFIDPSGGTGVGAGTAGDWLWVMNDYDAEVNGTPTEVVYNVSITVNE